MTTKERLYELVDALPEGIALGAAERALLHLRERADDPVLRALMEAPPDEEPETEDERAAVSQGLDDLRSGRVLSTQEIRQEFGW